MAQQLELYVLSCCYVCVIIAGPEGVARGEDALTVLESSQSRSQFIDELMEVQTDHTV